MGHITELSAIIQLFFLWNKARCDCLAQIMIALYSTRTVNVSILSEAFVGNAKPESNDKRIIRFLAWVRVNTNIQLIPNAINKCTNRHEMLEQNLTIVSKLILLNINEKGSIKRCPADRVYL